MNVGKICLGESLGEFLGEKAWAINSLVVCLCNSYSALRGVAGVDRVGTFDSPGAAGLKKKYFLE